MRFCLLVVAAAAFAAGPLSAAADPHAGFTPLFNGKDLAGWHGWAVHAKGGSPLDLAKATPEEREKLIAGWTEDAKKHWSVQNGELVNDGQGAYLATDKEFRDYELLLEYKTVAKADSGIYLKATPQVQIWDSTEESKFQLGADKGSGGLWNNSPGAAGKDPLVKADRPFGEWNKFRILQIGARTTIHLNDKLVVDHAILENFWNRKLPLPVAGSVLLQTHGGEIRFRNILVRELTAEQATAALRAKLPTGFTSLFDGKTLAGWAGATDNYEVVDGAIMCKAGKGGVLHTKDTYADFQVALEFQVPKNGNNGLAIRYPGTGDTAYTGMCELQVLDDGYKGIDPRQAHGSAYGMAAAARGYHRPVGAWNFQVVTVKGPTIHVELNGNVILDTDLSKITEYMAKSPHPGKDRTEGFFGFAGHGDAVQFRGVSIKPLK
ncbi:MAG: 3-keto-disaccharide hydrolase [Fimbriiglobus sp.]